MYHKTVSNSIVNFFKSVSESFYCKKTVKWKRLKLSETVEEPTVN